MCESAASIHAVCLARAVDDGRDDQLGARVEAIDAMLRAERGAVESACADLGGALRAVPDDASADDDLLEHAIASLTSRVARTVAVLLAHARDADAAIDEVLSAELDAERGRWVDLVGPSAAGASAAGPSAAGASAAGASAAGASAAMVREASGREAAGAGAAPRAAAPAVR